ncbi:hypothetical protein THIAE_08030 [Thiomicrospira aerophila AL3]|uniref:Blue (type 1) copper domain-containing protein n=1 Tax=Thiomicrospira aerophila AL3 TaxID=717772 RepID=W0DWU2_9GAMM|nr:cupredoxin family protein [Thiomicrospira aerophila]AHF01713.1 hypothetical protein THIAE_08030 [Thiomicrospira aerophila AL3]
MKNLSRRQFIFGASALALLPAASWAHNHGHGGHGGNGGGHHHGHGNHGSHGNHGHQGHQHHHGMDHTTKIGRQGQANEVTRTIQIDMTDDMRFSPDQLEIKVGDTVRFFVRNMGQLKHEFVMGTLDELKEHAEMMKYHPHMDHTEPNMISLNPRQRGAVIWHFDQPGTYYYGCLEPGHYEAGMIGKILVSN